MALDQFSPAVREWFTTSFPAPTEAQVQGWDAISKGDNTLILAPTGSGKTLAAFLWGIDQLVANPTPPDEPRTRILYISPLRALAVDVEKNLRSPLKGVTLAAERLGIATQQPSSAMRTGDTPQDERRRMLKHPADVLITTPESLYLMLTSRARETLAGVEAVIIDEIHAVAGTKRGAHLSLTLERLEELTEKPPQRIGLSATQRPLEEIARFLGGRNDDGAWRPVSIVDTGIRKELDIEVIVPVEDMAKLGEVVDEPMSGPASAGPVRRSIWPSIHPRLLDLIEEHTSTLIFVNARRMSERLATRLNELSDERAEDADPALLPERIEGSSFEKSSVEKYKGQVLPPHASGHGTAEESNVTVRAHHGSISREKRLEIEDQLKSGALDGLVATSSLELGIDMGAVDLVIQVESPRSVARGLQRIGRAGHQVGEASRGKLFPKHRADLLEATVVVDRMQKGLIEETHYLRNPLDVLAQHIVAITAMDDWPTEDLRRLVRRSANFAEISDDVFNGVLDLLAGRYPSEEFRELRPRVVWDRVEEVVRGRKGAQRLAVTNAGTIPDRGLFGVFMPDGTRVGELDEEMVYESRPGEVFLLGASTWRIQEITFERVIVTPAPGQPGKMPFWRGDGPGRPIELGRAMGAFVRDVREHEDPVAWLQAEVGLDALAAKNLIDYIADQEEATGAVPDDRTVVVERFRDEIGDWRVCIHTPFGARVHAPWAMALRSRMREEYGSDPEMIWSDDGIVIRLPDSMDDLPIESLLIHPADIEDIVISQLPDSALFASRFREAAGRALLLPRRRPGQRTPLWQQRQRSADLLATAVKYPDFPILLETVRECINDVFDLPALKEVLTGLDDRSIRLVVSETPKASPFAQSLLFGWIAVYMYEGDAPVAERRAAALALDKDLLRELLGSEELRELLDADVLANLELELQRLVSFRQARDADELHDVLRELGPLTRLELDARIAEGVNPEPLLAELADGRRIIEVALAGESHWAAAEDAAKLRDAVGVAIPMGLPAAFTDPIDQPLHELVMRFAHTHGPFLASQVSQRIGVSPDRAFATLEDLERSGRLLRGEFRPDGSDREWVEPEVLRRLRRQSLAALRKEVEPVEGDALARFLPNWQGVGVKRRGLDGLVEVIGILQGAALPVSVIESDILPARMAEYNPSDLDALCTAGEVMWVGAGSIGQRDGRVRLVYRDQARLFVSPVDEPPDHPEHDAIRAHLAARGASFWGELVQACADAEVPYDDATVLAALWDLVWAGEVTNDSLAPLRALLKGGTTTRATQRKGRSKPGRVRALGPPAAAGRWSLVAPSLLPQPSATEAAHARALQLLERYGVLTREAALGEGAQGGFAGVYPVLKALEEQGKVRRGYFVSGLGAAQFALPGAVDRLRGRRLRPDEVKPIALAATDPGQPFGASLPWPASSGRPARAAGAYVVVAEGEAVAFLERGGRSLVTFEVVGDANSDWVNALKDLVAAKRIRKLEIAKIDGEPADQSPVIQTLKAAGFTRSYKGWTWRT